MKMNKLLLSALATIQLFGFGLTYSMEDIAGNTAEYRYTNTDNAATENKEANNKNQISKAIVEMWKKAKESSPDKKFFWTTETTGGAADRIGLGNVSGKLYLSIRGTPSDKELPSLLSTQFANSRNNIMLPADIYTRCEKRGDFFECETDIVSMELDALNHEKSQLLFYVIQKTSDNQDLPFFKDYPLELECECQS